MYQYENEDQFELDDRSVSKEVHFESFKSIDHFLLLLLSMFFETVVLFVARYPLEVD